MLIDVHTHLGRVREERYTLDALRTNLDAIEATNALVAHLDEGDAGQRLDEVDANLSCLRASRREERLCPLYWSRPGHFDSNPYACAGALERERFVGVMLSPQMHGYELTDEARITPVLKALAHFGRPAVIYLRGDETEDANQVYQLAQNWPSMPFVLCGQQSVLTNAAYRDIVQMTQKRGDARIWLCTSHSTPEEIVHAVAGLGSRVLMYGTAAGLADGEQTAKADLEVLRSELSPEDFANLTYENAADLFSLRNAETASNQSG